MYDFLEIVSEQSDFSTTTVVIKNNCNDLLEKAKNPWLPVCEYITVCYGNSGTSYTFTEENGEKWSIDSGTFVSSNLENFKRNIRNYLEAEFFSKF